MNKLIFCIFVMLMMVDNALALSIVKPLKGDTYLVGQTLTVELQSLPDEDVERIIISTNDFSGAAINNAPFRYDVKLDKPVEGKESIGIVGELKNGKTILLATYIYVKLPLDVEVKDILLDDNIAIAYMSPVKNRTGKIKADGLSIDGTEFSLNSYTQTKYQSLNETIATVDSRGVITPVFPGETKVIVSAGNISKEVKVYVDYKLDSLKGITATALDKANEIKWEKSPYEGEIVSEYRIFRSKEYEGMGKVMVGAVPVGTASFIDTKLVSGEQYYYSVEAYSQKFKTGSDMELWVVPTTVVPLTLPH